jgi:hypothetical protein
VQARTQKRRTKLKRHFADGESAEQDNQEYQAKIEAELHSRTLPESEAKFDKFLRTALKLN